MCKKLAETLFNLGYIYFGQTPKRIQEVVAWYADRRSWQIYCWDHNQAEIAHRPWDPAIDLMDTVNHVLMLLYAIHDVEQWKDYLYLHKMGWEEDWRRVHLERSEGSSYHFHFLPTYILGRERLPKATENRHAAWWAQFHDLHASIKEEGIPLKQYPSIMARCNEAQIGVNRPNLLLYLRLFEHYRNTAASGWLNLIERYPEEVLRILKRHPKFEVYATYLEEHISYTYREIREDLVRLANEPRITPNPQAHRGVSLATQLSILAGKSPCQIANEITGSGWYSDNNVAARGLRSFNDRQELIHFAIEHDPMFIRVVEQLPLNYGQKEDLIYKVRRSVHHGQVAVWFFAKYAQNSEKWEQIRIIHGPAGETRQYRYIDMLDEIAFQDLVNGLRTSVDTVLEASARRLEALYLAEMGENLELPILKEVKETMIIKQIINSNDLKEEGKVQSNCVGGYIKSCLQQRSYIYTTGDRLEDRITIELISAGNKKFEIIQTKLKNNVSANQSPIAMKALDNWIRVNKKAGVDISITQL